MSAPDCTVLVAGVRLADTADELELGREPTALAEVTVTWGRGNTFAQPEPATATFAVLDRPGGTLFADRLHIGDPVEVHAAGDIARGTPIDVAIDGGFETLALGDPGLRLTTVAPAVATVVDVPTRAGIRSIRVTSPNAADNVVRIPPAAFTPGDPTGWDAIPRLGPNEWTWTIAVRPAVHAFATAIGIGYADPQTTEPTGIVGIQYRTAWGSAGGDWTVLSATVVANTAAADDWLGVTVTVDQATWAAPYGPFPPYSWTEAPGAWADYGPSYVDEFVLMAPAGGTVRDVLVFAGRITDLAATIADTAGSMRVDVTAVDQLAELENRYVGDEPWLAEPLTMRVDRILAAGGITTVPVTIDDPLGALVVSWRDVDNQSIGGLLSELAGGVDGVLWTATHATTGPYLWIENVAYRAQVETLEDVGGVVTIVVAGNRPAGRTVLDGCEIDAFALTWIRDVTDVITRVDVTWREQTVVDGKPEPTDRNVRVRDAALEDDPDGPGVRRVGLTTPLTTAADATDVAERILYRTRTPQGRIDGMTWDLGITPPAPGEAMATALDLLDGTIRLGRAIIVENADLWPTGKPLGNYLDGGRYVYDGAWTLGLILSPLGGMGESCQWDDLEAGWAWNEFDPAMAWADLYGVAGPLATLEGTN